MTVSKSFSQCDTNSICTKKVVLKHLYGESVKVGYLKQDTAFLNEIVVNQRHIIVVKDSLIANRNESLEVCYDWHASIVLENDSNKKQVKALGKKVALFKTVSLIFACISSALLLTR